MLQTKSANTAKLFADDEDSTLDSNAQDIVDLLGGCFLLHQGKLSYEAWLQILARAVECDTAVCVRWTMGKPEHDVTSIYGDFVDAPAGRSFFEIFSQLLAVNNTCLLCGLY